MEREVTKLQYSDHRIKISNVARDFIAGLISGSCACYVGHPLDTIKVRMQISNSKSSLSQSFLRIIRNEGISGLFKGVLSPIASRAPIVAVLFSTNKISKSIFSQYDELSEGKTEFISGCIAGVSAAFIIVPSDYLKIK